MIVADIPDDGAHYEISADEAARATVAAAAGLLSLPRLDATFDLVRRGDGVHVRGQVRAQVGQSCVVTLEPVESGLEEVVDLDYAPPVAGSAETPHRDFKRNKKRQEPAEPLENGMIDLGAVAIEFLILGLNPYPRKAGASFSPLAEKDDRPKPFAALEALKKRPGTA